MQNAHDDLWQRYQATKARSTAKYARDIAAEMGISEAELTAARVGHDAVRLHDDVRARRRQGRLHAVGRHRDQVRHRRREEPQRPGMQQVGTLERPERHRVRLAYSYVSVRVFSLAA